MGGKPYGVTSGETREENGAGLGSGVSRGMESWQGGELWDHMTRPLTYQDPSGCFTGNRLRWGISNSQQWQRQGVRL